MHKQSQNEKYKETFSLPENPKFVVGMTLRHKTLPEKQGTE